MSLLDFQSKDMESSNSSIGVESSRVTTEVDYSTRVDYLPTQDKLKNMFNAEKILFWNNREK